MKKIKVLQIFGSLNMGGAESRMMDVYRNIDRDKCSFDFLSLLTDENQYFENEIKSLGGRIFKLESPRKVGMIKHFKELLQLLKSGNYDAVHAHTSYYCGVVMLAAKIAKIPVRISHSRTTGSKQKNKIKVLFIKIGSMLINTFSTQRLAISKEAGNFLFGNKDFDVIPNSIDTVKYQQNIDKMILKNDLGIPRDSLVIGQIGRFDSMKNHRFTIKWFSEYVKTNEKAFLVLVGDGELREEIQALVKDLKIDNRVLFTGVRGDVPKIIHSFDVLIFPSIFEGLGGVVLEAQAAGVPAVVSTNIPEETEMGLNLIERCSLDASYEVWNEAVNTSINKEIPEALKINEAFLNRGYSIEAVTEKLFNIYGGKR